MEKQILLNQLSILTALQRINYKIQEEAIIKDLGQRIGETQEILKADTIIDNN